ncbi:MAG: MFS transporter [Acidobacteriota bacterium]|nr:MFS transporter [Blastocatellia bacterium]MDW8412840.1 MFS transporter [Acidobacteriota bacterium]
MTTKLFLEDLQEELLSHSDPKRWYGLIVLLASTFIVTLDGFIIYLALPAIKLQLHASPAQMQLLLASFQITNAALLIIGGKIGDLYGRRKLFSIGLIGYACTVLCCGFSRSANLLIALNALQGIAVAMLSPQTVSIIRLNFSLKERTYAFGLYNAITGAGAIVGLLAGGVVVEKLGWRAAFLITPPIAVTAFIAAFLLLKESRSGTRSRQIDLPGAGLLTASLSILIGSAIIGREKNWPPEALAFLSLASVLLLLFLAYEKKRTSLKASPLVHYALLSDRSFLAGIVAAMVYNTTQSSFYFVFTLYLQFGLQLSPKVVGMILVPMAVGFIFASMFSAKIPNKFEREAVGFGVLLTVSALLTLLIMLNKDASKTQIAMVTMAQGIGLGIASTPMYSLILSRVISNYAGVAAGMLNTVQQIGSALGIAFVGIVFFGILSKMEASGELNKIAYSRSFSAAILCHIIACSIVLLILPLLRHPKTTPTEPTEINKQTGPLR